MTEQKKHVAPPVDDSFDMEQEIRRQAERVKQTQIQKDTSYFDHCKSMMAQIHRDYRLAFFCCAAICLIVAVSAVFKKHFQIFSLVAYNMGEPDNFVAIFCGGFAQVFTAAAVMLVAFLAWSYLHRCHILLLAFYALMAILGVVNSDWFSAALGAAGTVFYLRAVLSMAEEERMRELEGYPNFNRELRLSKEDFDHAPWHPDAPDRDKAYTDMLAKKAEAAQTSSVKVESPASAPVPTPEQIAEKNEQILSEIIGEETAVSAEAKTATTENKPVQKNGKKGKKHGKRK